MNVIFLKKKKGKEKKKEEGAEEEERKEEEEGKEEGRGKPEENPSKQTCSVLPHDALSGLGLCRSTLAGRASAALS